MNPTQSQPERPEPPEGYRLLNESEKLQPLPLDVLVHNEDWTPDISDTQWGESNYAGEVLPEFQRENHYATRTAPEAVAGEFIEAPGRDSTILTGRVPLPDFEEPEYTRLKAQVDAIRANEEEKLRAEGRSEVIMIRCERHRSVPQKNQNACGNECGACIAAPTPPVEADKDAEKLREEVEAFVKHTGAPNFKEAVDVLIRTNAGHMEQVEKQFNKIKEQGKELATARATIAELRAQCDAEMLRVKACEHIAEGEEGWEKLENECPATAAVAKLRRALAERDKRIETLVGALEEMVRNGRKQGWNDNYPSSMKRADAALAHAAEGKEQA